VAVETVCVTAATACVTGAAADELASVPEALDEVGAEEVGAVAGAAADELVPVPEEVVPEEPVTCAAADETALVALEMSDELSAADALAVQSALAPRARVLTAIATTNRRRAQGTIDS
jgi:hypothetical protein